MVEISPCVLTSVQLTHFRNFDSADVKLCSRFNVFAAPNAQGKTNFLEALALLSTGRLLRGHHDREAIQHGKTFCRAQGTLQRHETSLAVVFDQTSKKKALINQKQLPRVADLIGRLPSVCVSLEDMQIVRGEPADRRLQLDLHLSALSPTYLRHLTTYKRALDQRNSLLRQGRMTRVDEFIEPWETQLAHHGVALRLLRRQLLQEISPIATEVHHAIGSGEILSLEYAPKDALEKEEELLGLLASGRALDIEKGSTSYGPHRDDFSVDIAGTPARLFGSQGQQRTAVLAVKFGMLRHMTSVLDEVPLLLLDDILSDLDKERRQALIEQILLHPGQAVLTCTDSDAAGTQIIQNAMVFGVKDGQIAKSR